MQICSFYSVFFFLVLPKKNEERKEASASLYSHRDESENGLKRGEKMEHNNNHVLLKAYLLLLFLYNGKMPFFLLTNICQKLHFFLQE